MDKNDTICATPFSKMSRPYLVAVAGWFLFLAGVVAMANRGMAPWLFAPATWIPFGDKVGHFVLMGIFSFLFNGAFRCRVVGRGGVRIMLGSLVVYLLVFAEEVSQIWLASRSFDGVDLLFDIAGIHLFGILAWRCGS